MKIYYHLNSEGFSNTYVVANEKTKDVIIIDPGEMNDEIIEQIEVNEFKLTSVLITHNHKSHVNGLKTMLKIYSPRIFGIMDFFVLAEENTLDAPVKSAPNTSPIFPPLLGSPKKGTSLEMSKPIFAPSIFPKTISIG